MCVCVCVCVCARACVFRRWRGRPAPRLAPEPGTTRAPTGIYPGPEDFLPSSLAILTSSPLLSTSDSSAHRATPGSRIPGSRTQKTLSGGQGFQISRQETKPEIHQQIGFTPPSNSPRARLRRQASMLPAQGTEPTLPTPWAFSERLNCPNLHFQVPTVNPPSYLPGMFASVPIHQEPTSILFPDPEIHCGDGCLWGK